MPTSSRYQHSIQKPKKLTRTAPMGLKSGAVDMRAQLFSEVRIISDFNAKARSEFTLKVKTSFELDGDVLYVPYQAKLASKGLLAPYCVTSSSGSTILVSMSNVTDEDIILRKDYVIGIMELLILNEDDENYEGMYVIDEDISDKMKDYDEIVSRIIERTFTSNDLKGNTKQKLEKILKDNCEVFSRNKKDLGYCPVIKHDIITRPVAPINLKPRRVPMALESKVDQEVDEMLDKGVIQPTVSPWNSPIVLVRKKNNDIRFCVDYRALNSVTLRPIFPLPDTKHILDHLEGSSYFTTIDVSSAFHQCEVREHDRLKTAFTTRHGQFEFIRMPFGLCGATATWQRLMHEILKGNNWEKCLIYVDDVIVFGKTVDQHLENLSIILKKLKEAGIKLSPSKCDFFKKTMKFLGHVISSDGIKTDPEKIQKVKAWCLPKTKDELRTFLAFCNYYRKFVKNFAQHTILLEKMMTNETKKSDALIWNDESMEAFENLKIQLVSAPLLGFPRGNGDTFILDTDASFDTIGSVLSQVQDGKEIVIEYGSRKMTKAEMKYCVTRKELLAVVHFAKQFRHYLLGAKFVIRIDHKALEWMLNWTKPSSTQYCKWIAELQQYDFIIQHRPGREHANADALSRLASCEQCDLLHLNPQKKRNVKDISNLYQCEITLSDEEIQKIHSVLGHPGKKKMVEFIKENYRDVMVNRQRVDKCIDSCIFCAKKKTYSASRRNKNLHMTASNPFERILIDVVGPVTQSKYGHRYFLGIIDVFSRFPMLIPLRDTSSSAIYNALFSRWICIFGKPREVISDNARNLNSEEFLMKLNDQGIQKTPTCPYYPQGKGIVERLFRTVKERLFATAKERKISWVEAIPYVEFGLRTTVNSSIEMPPCKAVFGRNIFSARENDLGNTLLYQHQIRLKMESIKKKSHWEPRFKKDQKVLVKSIQNKFMKPQYVGPAKIVAILENKMYSLEMSGRQFNRHEVYLKPYHDPVLLKNKNGQNQRYPQRLRSPVDRYF